MAFLPAPVFTWVLKCYELFLFPNRFALLPDKFHFDPVEALNHFCLPRLLTNGIPLTYLSSLKLCIPFNSCKITTKLEHILDFLTRLFTNRPSPPK